jgi:hypothetical protein
VQTIQNKGKGQRKLIEQEYDQYLSEYTSGDYGEIELAEDEKRLTVRNRFKAAAQRRGVGLAFLRTQGNLIRFKVAPGLEEVTGVGVGAAKGAASSEPPAVAEPAAVVASDVPPKKRGGRPRKSG